MSYNTSFIKKSSLITQINEEAEQEETTADDYGPYTSRGLRSNRDLALKNRIEMASAANGENLINSLNNSNTGGFDLGYKNHAGYNISSNISGPLSIQSDNIVDIKSINIGNTKNKSTQLSLSGIKNNMRSKDNSKLPKFMMNKGGSFGNHNANSNSRHFNNLLRKNSSSDQTMVSNFKSTNEIKSSTKNSKRRNKSYSFELNYHKISADMPDAVYMDTSLLPGCTEGDLVELKTYTTKKVASSTIAAESVQSESKFLHNTTVASIESSNFIKNIGSSTNKQQINNDVMKKNSFLKNKDKKLFFIAKNFPDNYSRRTKNPQISLSYDDYHSTLGISIRSTVYVKIKDKDQEHCDLVELMVKDCYVNRGDMWLIRNEINNITVNLNQRLTFINSLRLNVSGIYKDGKKVYSGCINEDSKVILRSESARFFFIIQITEEMWQFEEDGEVMFQKVVNSFFPKILKKWKKIGTNHNISIVFTATVDIESDDIRGDVNSSIPGYKSSNNKDYYRIVVDEVSITHWKSIMDTLRQEFMEFKQDLLNIKSDDETYHIQGKLASCVKTNILESINMVTTVLLNPFRQMDLRHTTTHVMIISPGTGLFDVDYDLLKLTTKKLQSLEVTMDIICLSTPPMHIVPLMRYIDNTDNLRFCVPTWLSISFWNESSRKYGDWKPTCRIYDLQVLNLTEDDFKASSMLKDLVSVKNIKKINSFIDHYDKNVFNLTSETVKKEIKETVGYFDMVTKLYNERKNSISNTSLLSSKIAPTNRQKESVREHLPKFIWNNSLIQKPTLQKVDTVQVTASKDSFLEEESKSTYSEAINTLKTVKSNSQLPKIAQKFSNLFYNKKETQSETTSLHDVIPLRKGLLSIDTVGKLSTDDLLSSTTPVLKKQHKLFTANSSGASLHPMFRSKGLNDEENASITKDKKKMKFQYDYWVNIENPSTAFDPERADDLISQRWKDVYPKYFAKNTSKWRSFTTPADLPVTTEVCPSINQFMEDYELRNYSVSLNSDLNSYSLSNNDFVLMRNLIYARLVSGYQIIQNKTNLKKIEENYHKTTLVEPATILNDPNAFKNQAIYMLGNDEIHRICCTGDSIIEIRQYINKTDRIIDFKVPTNISMIKTRYESDYRKARLDHLNAFRPVSNWNQIDQYLAGYNEDAEATFSSVKTFKSKFCVLSTDVPDYTIKSYGKENLDNEEIRLEGLRKLIAVLYRLRVKSGVEKKNSRKEEILPEIFFYTGSLQSFIRTQADSLNELIINNENTGNINAHLSSGIEIVDLGLTTKSDLRKIAYELQYGEHKLNLCTRSWRWISYKDSLVGSNLVNWLLKYFTDIETRDEAVSFGNFLMENGVIVHVLKNHGFLDGNYYYVIGPEFKDFDDYDSEINLQFSNNSKQKSPYTLKSRKSPTSFAPLLSMKSIKPNNLVSIDSKLSKEVKIDDKDDSSDIIALTPISDSLEKLQIMLSSSLQLDLDPLNTSTKPQILTVHFDRAHNPDHCFHIRFEWVTTTPRLVDDLITSLSKTADSYGLKFVEIPWGEMISVSTYNPFHSSVFIQLALNPLNDPLFKNCEIIKENKFYFHMCFLEKAGFLLDNRGSNFFDKNTEDTKEANFKYEIIYSWGKQTFKCAQYVHNTGAYIAEIINDGNLFLAPNNIHLSRVNTANNTSKTNDESVKSYIDSQKVMNDFKQTCSNYDELKGIFEKERTNWYSNKKMLKD
ncbi:hypothetical protein QEN19_002608 [Hanseniaspora menglaensis]